MEKLKEKVVKDVRACIVSMKGNMTLRTLQDDYRTMIGERIPYSKLGFRSLEEFIQSEPTLFLSTVNGEKIVSAKQLQQSSHIVKMVAVQKTDKKKKLRQLNRFNYHSKPAMTSQWRPKYTGQYTKKYHTSSRPAAVSHNQFVNVSYESPSVPSRVVVPDHSQFSRTVVRQNSQLSSRLHVGESSSAPERRVVFNEPSVTAHTSNSREEVSKISSSRQRISKKMSEMSLDRDSGNSSPTSDFAVNVGVHQIQPHVPQPLTQPMFSQQPLTKPLFPQQPLVQQPLIPPIIRPLNLTSKDEDHSTSVGGGRGRSVRARWSPGGLLLPGLNLKGGLVLSAGNDFKVPELVLTGNSVENLKKFAEYHKLGEVDVSIKGVKTKQNRFYSCRIKVGKNSYSSYPKEFDNPLAAEVHCSAEALEDLTSKYGKKKSLLLANDKDILQRIPPLLEKHHHGIWAWQLQLDYADKYNEQLPSDWLKVIDSSPCIQIEKCSDNYILRHCEPGEKEQKWRLSMNLTDVSVPSNTVSFVEDGKLYAQVTCVLAANEIWCRQLATEESDIFNQMEVDMGEYYKIHKDNFRVDSVNTDGYYVAEMDDNLWYRVRAINTVDDGVSCFFIDYGDELIIPVDNIFKLNREFALSQAQAFVCRMAGLEELYEMSATSEALQNILYSQVTLELASDDVVKNDIIPVYIYELETGESINQKLIPLLTIESALPVVQSGMITEVFVSNIESNGDIYVQLHSHGYFSLQTLLQDLEKQITSDPPTHLITQVTKSNSKGKYYYGKYKLDGHWYRIELIDWAPNEELAQIYFIDHGHTDVINVKEDILYPLETLSDILSQYPPQAVKVKMDMHDIPADFVTLAKKAMPENQPVLLKVIREHESERYTEFFKRNADGGLFCINKSVMMEAEIKESDTKYKSPRRNLLHMDGSHKNVPSGGKLKPPKIPEKQEYFEVHIPFAVNPYNFFVQPLESRNKLHQMMEQLQERYKDILYSPLTVDQIIPGNIYASKFDDGNWYRTSVIKVIHSGSISVFYCDFGYYSNLTVAQLIPLDVEFMKLPYQALKAKLFSVKPKQSKWTMEDCDYFKDLVEKKHFYSVLIDIENDELYESDIVLQLVLIDTSSSEDDIYIGTELIKRGIAVEVEPEEK